MKNRAGTLLAVLLACALFRSAHAAYAVPPEPPPDPGFEVSVQAADVIAEVEIIAGGAFRAVAQAHKFLKGSAPNVLELEGYNSYNWDVAHRGFQTGQRFILFLSRTGRTDVYAPLTPAAPRLSVQPDGALLTLGDPPFRVPLKKAVLEDALALLVEFNAAGQPPERAAGFVRGLWESGDIEPRCLAVALAGALHDARQVDLLAEAAKDKLLKMRLTAVEALGQAGSAQALAVLRGLLKDEKATVAREAARVLARLRDTESLAALLAWVRRNAEAIGAAAAKDAGAAAAKDSGAGKDKTTAVALEILKFAAEAGPLLEPEALVRPLLDLARCKNENLAREALHVFAAIAQRAQIPALLELAEDRVYDWHSAAELELQRVTLLPFRDTDEFRKWWGQYSQVFGEDTKRGLVETAARALAQADDTYERRAIADTIRLAPGEIALVSAAPLLLKSETSFFTASDLAGWNSSLAVPFLLERLGREGQVERRDALDGLVRLAAAHPRLQGALWPLLRGVLACEDGSSRRAAQAACGRLGRTDGLDALLDAVQYASGYESQEAAKALYALSARTLGFSIAEPLSDQLTARKHLRGWWESSKGAFQPLRFSTATVLPRIWAEAEPAVRAKQLEGCLLSDDSRRSAAAFAVLHGERGPADSFWRILVTHGRQRNRAYGLLGWFGGEAALAPELQKVLVSKGTEPEPPLCRALALVALATLRSAEAAGAARSGPAVLVDWLRGEGASADLVWRRLGVISLGLSDREPASLAFLETVVTAGLAALPADQDLFTTPKPSDEYALFAAAVPALCARSDSTALLAKVVEESTDRRARETAARALSVRRAASGAAAIAKGLEKTDRYDWQGLSRALEPLLKPADAQLLNALLDMSNSGPRYAGAYLFAQRPEVGADADTRGHLVIGLSDRANVVRFYCAAALGKRRSVAAIKKLVELLRDEDEDVRSAAAEALGNIGDVEACQAAAEAAELLVRPEVLWLRAMAIAGLPEHTRLLLKLCQSTAYLDQRSGFEALAFSRAPGALEMLLKTFRNDEAMFQTVAADALAQHAGAAVSALQQDLNGADKNARARALHLLGRIDTPASRAALHKALDDPEATIRALAEFALKRLDDRNNEQ
ncbi:MAG: HEAT repeat domain-containing protein [Planctomycetota bacterium]